MTAIREPTAEQRNASDPRHSVWVTANAGSGKTSVLSDRVLRLLLAGSPPEGILCITFTKTAAAEMVVRIESRLAEWATRAEPLLLAELEALGGRPPTPVEIGRARSLFAQVLDLPAGLAIMTIHALAGSLLRRFPIEAGIAPHFETIDEVGAADLLGQARNQTFAAANAEDGGPLSTALARLAATAADVTIKDAVGELIGARTRLLRVRDACGGMEGLFDTIAAALRVAPEDTPASVIERACRDGFNSDDLLAIAEGFRGPTKKRNDVALTIASWIDAAPRNRETVFEAYEKCFLTQTDAPRRDLVTEPFARENPGVASLYAREQVRIDAVRSKIKALTIAANTRALLQVGLDVIERYQRLKANRAALDYEDLIDRTARLLEMNGKSAWVLFKLDARIEHLLVDEAQDTSPDQWRIIERLIDDFFAGKGAHEMPRTLFVVGDEKQSIYSFQGADLEGFRRVRARLCRRAREGGEPMHDSRLSKSFRSTGTVLALVDKVFADRRAGDGVVEQGERLHHESSRRNDAGLVELWPLVPPQERRAPSTPWPLPDEIEDRRAPQHVLAGAIARRIGSWLRTGERLKASGRPIRPGDIMILMARRSRLQELVIRALKSEGVPVAGADRLSLREHIAVMDLVALGQAMLLPEDDLTLACLLKSPLLGLTEDQLFAIAHDRGDAPLIEAFRKAAQAGEPYGSLHERFVRWQNQADFMPPFEFYAWVLGADGGRRRLVSRLGVDAIEPIEAFIGQTLAYESGHPSSLQGFLLWFERGSTELKRDAENAGDRVRVMTIHGAKGLEAPIVFLADAGPKQEGRRKRLVWGRPEEGALDQALPFWRVGKYERDTFTSLCVERERLCASQESRRLLYVALTRARDRLYVAGCAPAKQSGEDDSWFVFVRDALQRLDDVQQHETEFAEGYRGTVLRLERGMKEEDVRSEDEGLWRADQQVALPRWMNTPALRERRPLSSLSPSRLAEAEPPQRPAHEGVTAVARKRGVLIHGALEIVPRIEGENRTRAIADYLALRTFDLGQDERRQIGAQIEAVLANRELAAVFGPEALEEQPVAGMVDGLVIAGQVDRMLIEPHAVTLVDFKTNASPPAEARLVPAAYVRQMALYAALVTVMFPGRAIRAGLVWTVSGAVHWLTQAQRDQALDEIRRIDQSTPAT